MSIEPFALFPFTLLTGGVAINCERALDIVGCIVFNGKLADGLGNDNGRGA